MTEEKETWSFDDAKYKLTLLKREIPNEVEVEVGLREVSDLEYQFEVWVYGYHLKEPLLKALHRTFGAFTASWKGQPDEDTQYHVWLIKNS